VLGRRLLLKEENMVLHWKLPHFVVIKKVVHILLDAGAEVNARGGEYGSALQRASYRGHEEVVQMQLYAGAEGDKSGDVSSK
jgi:ankyrin repeat protein